MLDTFQWSPNTFRYCKRFLYCLASSQSVINQIGITFEFSNPLRDGLSSVQVSLKSVITAVIILLNAGRPVAVFWFVVQIIIPSLNSMPIRWRLAHICKEILKRITPTFAHLNTASAVVFISLYVFVIAACFHIIPDMEQGSMASAVGQISNPPAIHSIASATLHSPSGQMIGANVLPLAAITSTKPESFILTTVGDLLFYNQTPKALTYQIEVTGISETVHVIRTSFTNNMDRTAESVSSVLGSVKIIDDNGGRVNG